MNIFDWIKESLESNAFTYGWVDPNTDEYHEVNMTGAEVVHLMLTVSGICVFILMLLS